MTMPKLQGVAVTIVTDGQLEHCGWLPPLHEALLSAGAESVDVQGWAHAVSRATFEALEKGAERVARTLRRMVQQDAAPDTAEVPKATRRLLLFDSAEALQRHERLDLTGAPVVRVGLVWSRQGVERWRGAAAHGFLLADASIRSVLDRPDLQEGTVHTCGPVLASDMLQPPAPAPLSSLGLPDGTRFVLVDATALTAAQFSQVLEGCAPRGAAAQGVYVWDADRPETAAMVRDVATRSGVQIQRFGAHGVFLALMPHADAVLIPARSHAWPQLELLQRPTLWLWPDTTWRPSALRPTEAAAFTAVQIRDGLRLLAGTESGQPGVSSEAQQRFSAHSTLTALLEIMARAQRPQVVAAPFSTPAPAGPVSTAPAGPFEVVGGPAAPRVAAPPRGGAVADPRRALTELLLEERRLQAELEAAVADRDRWMRRDLLAAERGESALQQVAQERARETQARMEGLQQGLARNRQAQAEVKQSARAGREGATWQAPAVVPDDEARFRELELAEKPPHPEEPDGAADPSRDPAEGPR